ncbi:hypothetical protein SK128_000846 [Halocaridina rubra]|uniref:Treslin STD domain-containing protein n=1 Tax=Halocaridina rubra TaxID=373956 RepID=A0AAN9AHC8_HALRR
MQAVLTLIIEQLAEEEERVLATERRAAVASEQLRRAQALELHVLNTVSDPQNTKELIQSLVLLRDSNEDEMDAYTTAQTIINLAVMHVRNICDSDVKMELKRILERDVLQSASDINSNYTSTSCFRQFKLQTLLHLELLWLFGYSSSSLTNGDGEENRGHTLREHHIGEAVKMLRALSLAYNPSTMATFMQETILIHFGDTLGEVLVEMFEELNLPLPESLSNLNEDGQLDFDTRPSSVKSTASLAGYQSSDSIDDPDSGKSREEKRTVRPLGILESSTHRIVVPVTSLALRRTVSDQPRQSSTASYFESANKEASKGDIQKVRRNLFDLRDGVSRSKFHRHHTIDSLPLSELKSPRKNEETSVKRCPTRSKCFEKTPIKLKGTCSKDSLTHNFKKGGILAPETPNHKVGQTIFNKKRVCKSTGTTIVFESPDVKRVCRTTPRTLRASLKVTRRNSFYSGAQSRNWEKAKTQLLANSICSTSNQHRNDKSFVKNATANFLFTDILSLSATKLNSKGNTNMINDCNKTPERRVLNLEHDDNDSYVNEDRGLSPASYLRQDDATSSTPVKHTRSPIANVSNLNFRGSVTKTPNHVMCDTLYEVTPGKKVQFDLTSTPDKLQLSNNVQTPQGKSNCTLGNPVTPKSILKTPKKTPNKTPSKVLHSLDLLLSTPKSRINKSSQETKTSHLYGVQENYYLQPNAAESDFSGFSDKNILLTPVKVNTIASCEESEIELISPSKKDRIQSEVLYIVHKSDISPGSPIELPNKIDEYEINDVKMSFEKQERFDNTSDIYFPNITPEDIGIIDKLMFNDFQNDRGLDYEETTSYSSRFTGDYSYYPDLQFRISHDDPCEGSPEMQSSSDDKNVISHAVNDLGNHLESFSSDIIDTSPGYDEGTSLSISRLLECHVDNPKIESQIDTEQKIHSYYDNIAHNDHNSQDGLEIGAGEPSIHSRYTSCDIEFAVRNRSPDRRSPSLSPEIPLDSRLVLSGEMFKKQATNIILERTRESETSETKNLMGSDMNLVSTKKDKSLRKHIQSSLKNKDCKSRYNSGKDSKCQAMTETQLPLYACKERNNSMNSITESASEHENDCKNEGNESVNVQDHLTEEDSTNELKIKRAESDRSLHLEHSEGVVGVMAQFEEIGTIDMDENFRTMEANVLSVRNSNKKLLPMECKEKVFVDKDNIFKKNGQLKRKYCYKACAIDKFKRISNSGCDNINKLKTEKLSYFRSGKSLSIPQNELAYKNYLDVFKNEAATESIAARILSSGSENEETSSFAALKSDHKNKRLLRSRCGGKHTEGILEFSISSGVAADSTNVSDKRLNSEDHDESMTERRSLAPQDSHDINPTLILKEPETCHSSSKLLASLKRVAHKSSRRKRSRNSFKHSIKNQRMSFSPTEWDQCCIENCVSSENCGGEDISLGSQNCSEYENKKRRYSSIEAEMHLCIKSQKGSSKYNGDGNNMSKDSQTSNEYHNNKRRFSGSKTGKYDSSPEIIASLASDADGKSANEKRSETSYRKQRLVAKSVEKYFSSKRRTRTDSSENYTGTPAEKTPSIIRTNKNWKSEVTDEYINNEKAKREACDSNEIHNIENINYTFLDYMNPMSHGKKCSESLTADDENLLQFPDNSGINKSSYRWIRKKIQLLCDDDAREQEVKKIPRRVQPRRSTVRSNNRRKSKRTCKMRNISFKEPSSDESFESFGEKEHAVIKMRRNIDYDFGTHDEIPEDLCKRKNRINVPLKNVENLPSQVNFSLGAESASDCSEEIPLFGRCSHKIDKQQKIDVHVSPDSKNSVSPVEPQNSIERPKRKLPEVSNDRRRIKPRRKMLKPSKVCRGYPSGKVRNNSPDHVEDNYTKISKQVNNIRNGQNSNVKKLVVKKKKQNTVKLKLTKSGDNYEVSQVDDILKITDADSNMEPQNLLVKAKTGESLANSREVDAPVRKHRKRRENEKSCIITPLRFTRHMSRDLSVSPELFSKLIALSPEKVPPSDHKNSNSKMALESSNHSSSYLDGEDIPDNCQAVENFGECVKSLPVCSRQSGMDDVISSEWMVQNMAGSPTLKTFIRKQKNKYSISLSPRIEVSPLHQQEMKQPFTNPSLKSLVHLSVSPILNHGGNGGSLSKRNNKPKSHRRLYTDKDSE